MLRPLKVIILGGYGNFGARIAKRLSGHPAIELIIAGRHLAQAQTLAAQLKNASAAQLNVYAKNLSASLRELNVDLVIHTAGPFQQQDYSIAIATAEAGAHYIDLADGRQFVCEFPEALHKTFSKASKLAITGASTVPALSAAVVNALSADMQQITEIDICIAPAQQAPRGIATLKAVLGYCGEPIPLLKQGKWTHGYGWSDLKRINFARMPPRLGALCDIPDLALFPKRYAGVQTVMFRAALEVGFAQRIFAAMAWLRRNHFLPRLEKLASFLHFMAQPLDYFGSKLGGMVVRVTGLSSNQTNISKAWHISADDNHGPEIPCMAAILLARKLATQQVNMTGAYCCMDFLTLDDFEPEFKFWGMQTDIL